MTTSFFKCHFNLPTTYKTFYDFYWSIAKVGAEEYCSRFIIISITSQNPLNRNGTNSISIPQTGSFQSLDLLRYSSIPLGFFYLPCQSLIFKYFFECRQSLPYKSFTPL